MSLLSPRRRQPDAGPARGAGSVGEGRGGEEHADHWAGSGAATRRQEGEGPTNSSIHSPGSYHYEVYIV